MSHRETHRVRTGHYERIDQEAASRIMTREWRGAIPRREMPAPVQENGETPDAVEARLAREALVPGALAVVCPVCGAAVASYCTTGILGVCLDRALIAVRQVTT